MNFDDKIFLYKRSQDGGQPCRQHCQQDDGSYQDAEPRKPRYYGHVILSDSHTTRKVARFFRSTFRLESNLKIENSSKLFGILSPILQQI